MAVKRNSACEKQFMYERFTVRLIDEFLPKVAILLR